MPINKEKNVSLQITFPKEDAKQLEVLKKAFLCNNVKVTKSDILLRAFRDYVRILVLTNSDNNTNTKEKKK